MSEVIENCSIEDVERLDIFLHFLNGVADNGVTQEIETSLLGMLKSISRGSHLIVEYRYPQLKRLTINRYILGSNKRIHDIKYLKYPPAAAVKKYGRCNLPGQSILYAALDVLTVLSELKPRKGDLITISTWRAKEGANLLVSPIFKRQPTNGTVNLRTLEIDKLYNKELAKYPVNKAKEVDLLNEFIADAFTKRHKSDNHLDYIISAFFTDRIFKELNDGNIEAIYYPSVQQKLSFENLAIKPEAFDSKYELIEVEESMIVHDLSFGNGGIGMEGISNCRMFDYAAGRVLWSAEFTQPKETIERFQQVYGFEI